ncbi:dynamin family protein [Bacillus sp. V5-8f]|uniref:dynamin family protein n=1 Tax=Bacillus sp. V5-8f TaxID=2053044 RepID=UPI000C770A1F|nr:dynamin family protein [Bacillus sp. V5-8f]PLT33627.1 DNA-binding protein [Bacillus sp. V5-8f]
MFDLQDFRQNVLKMTQEEFAKLIDSRQDYVSRMEKNPEAIDLSLLLKIASATGTTLDELVGYKKDLPKALSVDNTWETSSYIKKTMLEYIKVRMKDLNLEDTSHSNMVVELKKMIDSTLRKPTVAIVGMSDAGKSRLINSLIGQDKMPTSWTPTTSISVHIKHVEDRPSFIKEEAWIFKGGKKGFDVHKLHDQAYCEKYKIAAGEAHILSDYGTRQGSKYLEDASAAIIFVESPILQICDIVDLPGFGTGDRVNDDKLAQKSKEFADIVIYLSIANGFLRGTDIEFIKNSINSLPVLENRGNDLKPLNNLFVLASQAHTVNGGSKNDLLDILDAGSKRLYNEIPEEIWENRAEASGYSYQEIHLRERFFTYTTDKPYLREDFEQDLKQLLEVLPVMINDKSKTSIQEFIASQKKELQIEINSYYGMLKKREQLIQYFNELKDNEPQRMNDNYQSRMNVLEKIQSFRQETINTFEDVYAEIISVDNIVEIIKKQGYKKKKDDIERLGGFISSKIQAKLQDILKKKSSDLNDVIDRFIKDFDESIKKPSNLDLDTYVIPFDSVKVFASGLAGLATFGGLAIWASTLGNLGAYILVAKGVSVLSAVGISVAGGTAGAASVVAALGGPITLGIALAVIVSLSVFAFVSGGWQKSIAKKMVKEYGKQNTLQKFVSEIDKFWNDTQMEFETAADHLEEEWQQKLKELVDEIASYSVEELEANIFKGKKMTDFFESVPLNELTMA